MRPILVDTDILIEVLRGRDRNILERWRELAVSDTAILCSPVTIAEIWHGARPREDEPLNSLFRVLITAPIDAAIGRRAGDYLRQYHKSHGTELGDALIAATAALHGASLWTRNRKHYPVPDLVFY